MATNKDFKIKNGLITGSHIKPNTNGAIDIGASNVKFQNLHLSGKVLVPEIETSGSFTLDVGGNITLNADGSYVMFNDDTINFAQFYQNASGNLNIQAPTQDKDIIFKGNDGGTTVTALTLDMSVGGQLKATPLGVSTPTYAFSNDSNTGMTRPTGDTLQFVTNGAERLRISNTSININNSVSYFNVGSGAGGSGTSIDNAGNIETDGSTSTGDLKIGSTTVINGARSLTNIASANVSGNVTIDYTGNGTNDAGLFVQNDASDWGIRIHKISTHSYGMQIRAGGDYVFRTLNSSGLERFRIDEDGDIETVRNINSTGFIKSTIGIYNASGEVIDLNDATYTIIKNPENVPTLYMGDSGDNGNYYDNNHHNFRASGGGTPWVRILSSGVNVQSGGYQINGQTVISSARNLQNIGTYSGSDTLTITKNQVTSNFATNPAIRVHPASVSSSGGRSALFLGTSTIDNYGISLRGARLGTNGNPTFEVAVHQNSGNGLVALSIDTNRNASFSHNVQMSSGNAEGKFAVKSTAVHSSYDFYNNGTSYFNGSVTIDDDLSITNGKVTINEGNVADQLVIYRTSPSANQVGMKFDVHGVHSRFFGVGTDGHPYWSTTADLTGAGNGVWHSGLSDFKVGNVSVLTSSRNLQNIGTVNAQNLSASSEIFLGASSLGKISQSGNNWIFNTWANSQYNERLRITDNGITVSSSTMNSVIVGEDGTYSGYGVLGFGGTTNGYNRIFGRDDVNDGLYLASATGRHIAFRTNGGSSETFRMTSDGKLQAGSSNTTILDANRNLQNIASITSGAITVNSGTSYFPKLDSPEFRNTTAVSNATTPSNTAGWFKIAKVTRGAGKILLSFTGGNYSPDTYVIEYFKNWSTIASLTLKQYSNSSFITKAKIRQDSSDNNYYVEIYCSSNSNGLNFQVYHQRLSGYFQDTNIVYGGSLTAGSTSGTDYVTEKFFEGYGGLTLQEFRSDIYQGNININNGELRIGNTAVITNSRNLVNVNTMYLDSYIYHEGDTDTLIGFNGLDSFKVRTGGGDRFVVGNDDSYFNNNLGVGTDSPSAKLTIKTSASGNSASFQSGTSTSGHYSGITLNAYSVSGVDWYGSEIRNILTASNPNYLNPRLGFFTQDNNTYLPADRTEKMSILGNGKVGIGIVNPSSMLVVSDSGGAGLEFIPQTSNDRTTLLSYDRNSSTYQTIDFDGSDIHFNIAGNDVGRWNSSGHLLVGTANASNTVAGFRAYSGGNIGIAINGQSAEFNRLSSDGSILGFQKDSTTVGNIDARGGDLVIRTGDTGIRFNDSDNAVMPHHATDVINNQIDIGHSSYKFKDLHLSGTISSGAISSSGNLTLTQSSGNNTLYLNSSGGGNPVIYMEDSTRKWGQFVAGGVLYIKNETANIDTLKLENNGNITFVGDMNIGGTGNNNVRVRHIEGKDSQSANYGPLFLNYTSTQNVQIGHSGNQNDLYIYGALRIGSNAVIDYSRNITGTTITGAQFKWNTDSAGTNYLGTDIYDGLVLHSRPGESIFYGSGETSSSVKAHRFYTGTTSNSALGNEVFSITAGGDATFTGDIQCNGNINASLVGANNISGLVLQLNGTTVVDTARNIVNVGTISSGAITSSGDMLLNSGNTFTDLNIKSDRTSGNIGGVNFVNFTDDIKGQIYGHTDGTVRISTGGSTVALTLDASQNSTFAGDIKLEPSSAIHMDFGQGMTSDIVAGSGSTVKFGGISTNDDVTAQLVAFGENGIFQVADGETTIQGSHGELLHFKTSSTEFEGAIGSRSESSYNLFMEAGSGTSAVGFKVMTAFGSHYISPSQDQGATADNMLRLGFSSNRYKELYAVDGSINTSDINEKQDIQELTDAEQRVALTCKGLIRRYKWNHAVEEKGEDARYHIGIMAQDLQQAFTDEGLDATKYGLFTSDTWENEDGTEETRLGVRYNELLAFIISAI